MCWFINVPRFSFLFQFRFPVCQFVRSAVHNSSPFVCFAQELSSPPFQIDLRLYKQLFASQALQTYMCRRWPNVQSKKAKKRKKWLCPAPKRVWYIFNSAAKMFYYVLILIRLLKLIGEQMQRYEFGNIICFFIHIAVFVCDWRQTEYKTHTAIPLNQICMEHGKIWSCLCCTKKKRRQDNKIIITLLWNQTTVVAVVAHELWFIILIKRIERARAQTMAHS